MNKNYELEKRVLTIVSRQFEGIYHINLDDKAVTCVYDIKDEAGAVSYTHLTLPTILLV